MRRLPPVSLACLVGLSLTAMISCFEDPTPLGNTSDDATSGDGDGDGDPGDGDGDSGDGDGDSGDGDGDSGDGDSGDGDGDSGDGDGDPVCDCEPHEGCDQGTCIEPAMILYVNLSAEGNFIYDTGENDATANVHSVDPTLTGNLPGYGGGPKEMVLRAGILADFAPFAPSLDFPEPNGIHVTFERPFLAPEYSMVVVTPDSPFPGVLGIAGELDCGNQNRSNVYFAFLHENDAMSTNEQINVISSGAGLSMGLERVAHAGEIMDQFLEDIDAQFIDACFDKDVGVFGCLTHHELFCPEGQNSFAELRSYASQD